MVHTFYSCGIYVALDTDSGAVHLIDETVYDVLQHYSQGQEAVFANLKHRYSADVLSEVIAEIEALQADGQLFAQYDFADALPKTNNEQGLIKALCLHAAHDCNLRCDYCFAATGNFQGVRCLMDEKVGFAAIDFLIENSGERTLLEMDFFGGEPLMNFEVIKKVVAYGRQREAQCGKQFRFTITTNGLGLRADVIEYINREMDNVVISIDGRQEVHDHLRKTVTGEGSYRHIIENAKKLAASRNQERYYIRGTFTTYNTDFAQDVLSLYQEGFEQLSLEPVVAPESAHYALREEQLPAILNEYETLAQTYLQHRSEGKWFNFFHFMMDLEGPCVIKRLIGCGAGSEYLAVTPEGDLYPCHQFVGMEEYRMGNIMQGTLNRQIQARFARNNVLNKPDCKDCWAKYFCSGGCHANAALYGSSIEGRYAFGCEMEKKRLECAIAIAVLESGVEAE